MNRQFFMVLGCVTLLAVSAYAQQSPPSGDADQQVFNNSCRTCHTTAASSGRCRTCNHGSTEVPSVGFAEAHDVLPLIVWLHRDALTKRLDAEIDSESDGAAALTQDARKQQENVVQGDLLVVERDEAALVWRAMRERLPVDHRADCAPQAILGCMIVTAPRVDANGSSRDRAIDIVHHSGQRR